MSSLKTSSFGLLLFPNAHKNMLFITNLKLYIIYDEHVYIYTWNFILNNLTLQCMFTVAVNTPKTQPKTTVVHNVTMATMLQLLYSSHMNIEFTL